MLCVQSKHFYPLYPQLWCLESSFSPRLVWFLKRPTPVLAHDINSRCGMWEVVLIFVLFLTFLSPAQRLQTVSQVQQGSFVCALRCLSPSLIGTAWQLAVPPSLSPGGLSSPCWAGEGWRTPGSVLPGPAAMCNAQQLAPVKHSSWGPSASWEIPTGICLLKLLVGCLLFLPAVKKQPVSLTLSPPPLAFRAWAALWLQILHLSIYLNMSLSLL